jgi:DNA primase (bacterial type)
MPGFVDIAPIRQFSIVEFLARLGHHPVRRSGREHMYHSMLRATAQRTPSLAVWDSGGKWKDWGGANTSGIDGGGIIQLGMAYWPNLPFIDVLHRVAEVCSLDTARIEGYRAPDRTLEAAPKSPGYRLLHTTPVGTHNYLTDYLRSRGVLEEARQFMEELHYVHGNSPEGQRPFKAVGWRNESGGWEFSHPKGYKGSIGPKGVSVIAGGDPTRAVLFEGYFDFLSWAAVEGTPPMPTVVVLNSVAMLDRAMTHVQGKATVDVYFDNDDAGRGATGKVLAELPHARDRSDIYAGHKDYNELLKAEMAGTTRQIRARPSR